MSQNQSRQENHVNALKIAKPLLPRDLYLCKVKPFFDDLSLFYDSILLKYYY
jgi:hypothetical protein